MVSWDGDVLIEDATFDENGIIIKMKERWVRQTLSLPKSIAMELVKTPILNFQSAPLLMNTIR